MNRRRPANIAAFLIGGMVLLLIAAGVLFYRDLAVEFHFSCLERDPRYLVQLSDAATGSTGEEAFRAYIETERGREHLRREFVREMLEHLRTGGIQSATAPLDVADWDQVELEVRRLHYEGPSEEWWITYSARSVSGRRTAGSTRASGSLARLERHLTGLELEGRGGISLAAFPDLEFTFQPSRVEEGEWRVLARRRSPARSSNDQIPKKPQ